MSGLTGLPLYDRQVAYLVRTQDNSWVYFSVVHLFICFALFLFSVFFPLRSNTTGAKILSYYLGLQNTNGDSVKSLIKH